MNEIRNPKSEIRNSHLPFLEFIDEPGLYGLMGGAGAGKTTMAISSGLKFYQIDWRFIGNSEDRKELLRKKQLRSLNALRDAANQMNWWDWEAIEEDLEKLQSGKQVTIVGAYNRATGFNDQKIVIAPGGTILVEGALLGPPPLAGKMKKIFWIRVPALDRLRSMIEKDGARRSLEDILARFLITQYSEAIYYREIRSWKMPIVNIDRSGNIGMAIDDMLAISHEEPKPKWLPVEIV